MTQKGGKELNGLKKADGIPTLTLLYTDKHTCDTI